MKTAFYSDIMTIEGKNVITKTIVHDEIIKDNYTMIKTVDEKENAVEDRYFNKEYLQRL
jgi:hypothetical protein